MRTRVRGLLELMCGWWVGVAAFPERDRIRVVFQFDPDEQIPAHGTKVLWLTPAEADELREELEAAAREVSAGGETA